MCKCKLVSFTTGLRIGAKLMMDTFLRENAPFENFLKG